MKSDLLNLLACPACKHELNLNDSVANDDEIMSGELQCVNCGSRYQVSDGVPDLRIPGDEPDGSYTASR